MALTMLGLVVVGCSNSLPSSVASAPVLSVATGLFPLAQAAEAVGGSKAVVDDVVPAGSDPFSFEPTSQQADILRSAGLVIEVGGGFQPGLEAAAAGTPSALRLGSALGRRDGYVWLDPDTMKKAVGSIADAMARADPQAAPLFRQNATSFSEEISSTGIDFSSTLSTCPGTAIVTPDDAFTAMAATYGLTDYVVGANAGQAESDRLVTTLETAVQPARAVNEPWVGGAGVTRVAAAAGLRTISLDTLAGPPAGGWPAGSDYIKLMEKTLVELGNALGCNTGSSD